MNRVLSSVALRCFECSHAARFPRAIIIVIALLWSTPTVGQTLSYLLPDIGAPGMATYVEGIAPPGEAGSFGADGLYLNNPGNAVRFECVRPEDTLKVTIGPVLVSWQGRMFATHIFVAPWLRPPSHDWRLLGTDWRIPLRFVRNGLASDTVIFYLVRPHPFMRIDRGVTLGDGAWGVRSPRGAMIVEGLDARAAGVAVSRADCDPFTEGNQGLLPFVLLSEGDIIGREGAYLDVSASGSDAGPGGGGGGGSFCLGATGGTPGGSGFTAGGPGGRSVLPPSPVLDYRYPQAESSGSVAGAQGASLNGVRGAESRGFRASGGGSGHPFGQAGVGWDSMAGAAAAGGYGGASAPPPGERSHGANALDAADSLGIWHGHAHGNPQLQPLGGGSGGASAYVEHPAVCAGAGGGGGGALRIAGRRVQGLGLRARGGDGVKEAGGDGGQGSGGSIHVAARVDEVTVGVDVSGGAELPVAAGRVRIDGAATAIATLPTDVQIANGPTLDSTSMIRRSSFTIAGTGNGARVHLYRRSITMPWQRIATVVDYVGPRWSVALELPGNDQVYHIVALQEEEQVSTSTFEAVAPWTMGQAAAGTLYNREARVDVEALAPPAMTVRSCEPLLVDSVRVRNNSDAPMLIVEADLLVSKVFSLIDSTSFPRLLRGGQTLALAIQCDATMDAGTLLRDTVLLRCGTSSREPVLLHIPLEARVERFAFDMSERALRLGSMDLCSEATREGVVDFVNSGNGAITLFQLQNTVPELLLGTESGKGFPLTVEAGRIERLRWKFSPTGERASIDGELQLMAAMGACVERITVPVSATVDSTAIHTPDALDFGRAVSTSFPVTRSVDIRNVGSTTVGMTLTLVGSARFGFTSQPPVALAPGEEVRVYLRFDDPGDRGVHEGAVQVQTDPACASTTIRLTAERIPDVLRLSIDDMRGEVGDTVWIAVRAAFPAVGGALDRTLSIDGVLRCDASLLVPVGASRGVVERGERSVPVRITIPAGKDSETIALPYLVTLGRVDTSGLHIDDVIVRNVDVDVERQDGLFTLVGLCEEGGTRLFDGSQRAGIRAIAPQPMSDRAEILLRSIESGAHTVALYDVLGRRVRDVYHGALEAGMHRLAFDGFDLRSGTYLVLFTTPTMQFSRPVVIAR